MKTLVPVHHAFKLMGLWLFLLGTSFTASAQCYANYSFTADSLNPRTLHFTNLSSGSGPLTYRWTYTIGGPDSIANPTRTFPDSLHSVTVCLTTYGSGGCADAMCKTINLDSLNPCNANFTYTIDSLNPRKVYFNSLNTNPGMSYSWNFGDGDVSTANDPVHTYVLGNTYFVTLTVTNPMDSNCTGYVVKSVNVINCPPLTASFTYNTSDTLNILSVTNTSSNAGDSNAVYFWEFGDGTYSFLKDPPTHFYSAPGIYNTCLTVISSFDTTCRTKICKKIAIRYCTPVFNTTFLGGGSFLFTNSQPADNLSYLWTYGDGGYSTGINGGNYTYAGPGTYVVCLRAQNQDSSCAGTTCDTVVFAFPCNAGFTFTTDSLNNRTLHFKSTSTGQAPLSYHWNFANQGYDTTANPTFTFDSLGSVKTICLTISGPSCLDTFCQTINLDTFQPCRADFTFAADSGNFRKVHFTNLSTGQAPLSYHWNFAGQGSSSQVNPSFTFSNTSGPKTVCLTIWSPGCIDTICKTIYFDTLHPCKAEFTCTIDYDSQTVNFTNLSTGVAPLSSFWVFSKDTMHQYSGSQNPSFGYYTPGSYTACLYMTSATGCEDSICKNITIVPDTLAPCNADFSYTVRKDPGGISYIVDLSDQSSHSGPVNYLWTTYFDSTSVSGTLPVQNVTVSYATPGYKKICFRISGPGCADSICKWIYIDSNLTVPCNADFSYTVLDSTQAIQLTNLSTSQDFLSYYWTLSLGDSQLSAAIIQNPMFTCPSPGAYTVCLFISSPGGCRDTICKMIYIDSNVTAPCDADFTYEIVGGTTVQFTSKYPYEYFVWDFNQEGLNYSDLNPFFTFSSPGNKLVCLTLYACSDTICKIINLDTLNHPCQADFNYQFVGNNTVQFTNTSSYAGHASFTWVFDSEGNSTSMNPGFTFNTPGPKTVCLVLDANCTDTICKIINVPMDTIAPCSVNFVYNIYPDTFGGTGRIVMFNSTTYGGGNYAYLWNFGDGSYSHMADPVHYYASNGQYNVCVIAIDTFTQCRDTACWTVSIEPDSVPTGVSELQDMAHIKLYPVPVSQHLSIDLTLRSRADVTVRVYDLLGKSHYEQVHPLQNGNNGIDVDLSGLKAGLYFVELRTEKQTLNYRVLKN